MEKQRIAELESKLSLFMAEGLTPNAPLNSISRWRIGGDVALLVEPNSLEQAARAYSLIVSSGLAYLVVGEMSNILFDSRGFDGVLIRLGAHVSDLVIDGTTVRAQAGLSVPVLVRRMAELGLTGLEHAAGIPGTIGGLVVMNGGSQRKGVGSVVTSVRYAGPSGRIVTASHQKLEFAYRSSKLQRMQALVLEVILEMQRGDAEQSLSEIDGILAERAAKFPLDLPNCGSTFLSDPSMYAIVGPPGHAIEQAGLKGVERGDAQISEQHANFIVNRGSATSDDVLWLIALARTTVHAQTGFWMDCEVRHLSPAGHLLPAHVAAADRWPIVNPSNGA